MVLEETSDWLRKGIFFPGDQRLVALLLPHREELVQVFLGPFWKMCFREGKRFASMDDRVDTMKVSN